MWKFNKKKYFYLIKNLANLFNFNFFSNYKISKNLMNLNL